MFKLRVFVAVAVIALVVPLAVSGQKDRPPKPPVTADCTMAGEVDSQTAIVTVGRDVASYGPVNQVLYIDESLLPPLGTTNFPDAVEELRALDPDGDGFYGPYYGQIRVLDDRLDYWFDSSTGCGEAITSGTPCRFRLVVTDGAAVYTGKGKTRTLYSVVFANGRTLIDYRQCDPATNPACYVRLFGCYNDRDCPGATPGDYVHATVDVLFR